MTVVGVGGGCPPEKSSLCSPAAGLLYLRVPLCVLPGSDAAGHLHAAFAPLHLEVCSTLVPYKETGSVFYCVISYFRY